jgi:hypothetical protein
MKKRTFAAIAAVMALLFLSLSFRKDASISNKERELSLNAPNGQRIATGVRALKAEAAQLLARKHGSVQAFEITGVSFLPVKKGYAAIVSYRLQDGTTSSYGIFSGVQLKLPHKKALSMEANYDQVKIVCLGICFCHLSVTIDTDTGVITVDCGCLTCGAIMLGGE